MKCLQTIVGVLGAIVLVGSIGTSLQQQASATIVYQHDFKKLTSDMEKNVLDALAANPPEPDRVQTLLNNYVDDVMALIRSPAPAPETK